MAGMLRDCGHGDNRCSLQRNQRELIRLIKEEERFEAVIMDEVICTSAHEKLCLPISFVETSGKNMLRRENFPVLCSRILMKDENLS